MSPTDQVTIRSCESHLDHRRCVDLQRRIWGFSDEDVVPAALFVVAQHTGGHAYCAFHEDQPVGFALAFSASHDAHQLWHSHMVGVIPEFQGRGIGKLIKLHQRDEALRLGISTIEWTFDPLQPGNAYFNLERLGAVVRRYIPNCYGESTSPLHASLPTDRLVAEWHLRSPRVEAILNTKRPRASHAGAMEASFPTRARELDAAAEIQASLRAKLSDFFSRGYAITGFARGPETCTFTLEPYEA